MKKSLSSFGDEKLEKEKVHINEQDSIMQEYYKIKNLSQQEAQNQLFSEVLKQKQNGTFNFNALSQQVETLKNYLPEKDYQNLKRMLENLK